MTELFERLRSLQLRRDDYAVFGSGPLVVRGVIEATNDLDVLCRGEAWETVCRLAPPQHDRQWDVELVSLYDDRLTFGTTWAIGEVSTNDVIDTAEIIEGLPFAKLEYVVEYKTTSGRPKDLAHLAALARFGRAGLDRSSPLESPEGSGTVRMP